MLFRNPDGKPEEHNQYFLPIYLNMILFSSVDDLSKLVEAITTEKTSPITGIKWNSDKDGVCKDGICVRENPPAFSFNYPHNYTVMEHVETPYSRPICEIRNSSGSSPLIYVSVLKIDSDLNHYFDQALKAVKESLKVRGCTDIKVIYSRSVPSNVFGQDYPAHEFEIESLIGGGILLTVYYNVIAKDGFAIRMGGGCFVKEDIDEIIKPIFHSIDLEP